MNTKQRKKDYAHHQQFDLFIPYQFLLLCRVLDVPPVQVLCNFMSNAGQETYGQGSEQKQKAMEYFIAAGHAQLHNTQQEIRQMFRELEAIGSLWPAGSKMKFIEQHNQWKNNYYRYWFEKWIRKKRQKQLP